MTETNIAPEDALRYAAAKLRECVDWTTDAIVGAGCDENDGHQSPCDEIRDMTRHIEVLARQYGDPQFYSDGRRVKSRAEIENHFTTEHVWHPDPNSEKPHSWRSHLLSDPGVPSPGIYEVSTDPQTQQIHVRVIRVV